MKRFLSACLSLLLCFSMTAGSLPAQAAGTSIPITEEYFPDPEFRKFLKTQASDMELIDKNQDGFLDMGERSAVKSLWMGDGYGGVEILTDVTGIAYFPNLQTLYIAGNAITELDLSGNPKLTFVDVSNNLLTDLDLTHNTMLVDVRCSNNNLTALHLGKHPQMDTLYCSGNKLESLDLMGCTYLMWVEMEQNYLREIELPVLSNMMLLAPCFQKNGETVTVICHQNPFPFRLAHNKSNGMTVMEDNYYWAEKAFIDPNKGKIQMDPDGYPIGDIVLNPGVTSAEIVMSSTYDGTEQPASFILKLWQEPPKIEYTQVIGRAPTCTETGVMDHYVGSDGKLYTADADGNMIQVKPQSLIIPALGHDWNPTEYSWSDDYSVCTASRTCKHENPGMHSEAQRVWTYAEVVERPTRTELGKTMYIADFDVDWAVDKTLFVRNVPYGNFNVSLEYDGSRGYAYRDKASAAEGETVNIFVTPYDGQCIQRIWINSENGDVSLTDSGDGKYSFIAPGCDCCIHIEFTADSQAFEDVSPNAYYFDAVNWAVRRNITSGISPTKFGPNQSCTRAQAVSFIWRASGCPEPTLTVNPFADVSMNSYYAKAVLWAVEEGIASGISSNMFGPNRPCTRAQIVSFLYRGSGKPPVDGGLPFVDVSEHDFYADAVKWAVAKNITAGITPASFCPGQNCTRAQIVSFLMRAEKGGS